MLFFPRTDDTKDLKILIKKGIFDYDGRDKKVYNGTGITPGEETGTGYTYDYYVEYESFTFDKEKIYVNNEEISLADLLLGKVIRKAAFDDEILEILNKRGLNIKPISVGYTRALFYMGESYDSEDHPIDGYLVVKEGE